MATVIKNDSSRWQAVGTAQSMVIDASNNLVSATIGTAFDPVEAEYYQIQVQCTGGAFFTMDSADSTGAIAFRVADDFTVVWNYTTLNNSSWSRRGASDGVLIIQPVRG
jgi:hypothetical protein